MTRTSGGFFGNIRKRAIRVSGFCSQISTWRRMRAEGKDEPPFEGLLGAVASKLKRHPLIEYGEDDARIQAERGKRLVNAPEGCVLINKPDQAS